jgi:2-polyprenyl-3-methyl-5-hydroxy-6-metoxy-1,4-benzoquinol methylase
MENWKNIWNKKTVKDVNDLQDLINANGFDTSCLFVNNLTDYIDSIRVKMGMKEGESVFEAGCGCGSILYILNKANLRVGGSDYSESLIEIAKQLNISDDITVGVANELPSEPKYDYVIANSLFQYFPDLKYAEDVACLMMEKSLKGSIAILDVNDLAKQELYLDIRRKAEPDYDTKYKDFQHLFIEKRFWIELACKYNWEVTIEDQNIAEYKNSKFRYNIFITKA